MGTTAIREGEPEPHSTVAREIQKLEAEARQHAANTTGHLEETDFMDAWHTADEDTPGAPRSTSQALPLPSGRASLSRQTRSSSSPTVDNYYAYQGRDTCSSGGW